MVREAKCGMSNAECGIARTDLGPSIPHSAFRMRNSECGMRNGRAEVGSRDSAFRIRHSALGLSHHRPPALRRRRRLVRRPLRAPQPARRHPPAHRAPRRRARARGHAHRPRAVGRPLPLYDGPRERPLLRRGGADPAPLARAGRLPPRRRRLRDGPVVPARDRAGLPRPSAGRGAAQPPRLSPGIRLSEGDPQDPRARRAAGAGVRRVLGRPSRRILFVSDGPRRRLGRSRGPSRSSGAPRGGAAHGRESFHLRRELDPVTDTAARLRRLGLPHARARAGAVLLASAGVAFAIAAAGLALAPRIAAVLGAWLLLAAVAGAAGWLARRAWLGAWSKGWRGPAPAASWDCLRPRPERARARSCSASPTGARRRRSSARRRPWGGCWRATPARRWSRAASPWPWARRCSWR